MSQYQTRLPGGVRVRKRSTLNIYTGLSFLTLLILAVGVAYMWFAAMKVAPDNATNPFMFR
ncbi:MAG TPA: hypothetical protein ENJ06_05110 [Phycisphaeraceae bacterium]|nr:hypothetical protein [Phycisphaeraceae bacterium]